MKNVLITGIAGFIGSTLFDLLKQKKYNVCGIDNLSTGKVNNIPDIPTDSLFILDLSDSAIIPYIKTKIESLRIDTIFHLAALPNVQQSLEQTSITHAHTVTTTVNLLEAMKNTCAKKIIFSSTSAVYGNCNTLPTDEKSVINPLTPYALQKSICEQYIKMYTTLYDINAVCLRYFNVFGERMTNAGAYKSVISTFKEQKEKKIPLTKTNDGEQRRDFVYVKDVANANFLCGAADISSFEIFNIGTGVNFSVNEIAKCFNLASVFIGDRVESRTTLCNNTKAATILKWKPTVDVVNWIKTIL